MKFEVGDRVRFTTWPFVGQTGTVVGIHSKDPAFPYDVDIDDIDDDVIIAVGYPTAEREIHYVD